MLRRTSTIGFALTSVLAGCAKDNNPQPLPSNTVVSSVSQKSVTPQEEVEAKYLSLIKGHSQLPKQAGDLLRQALWEETMAQNPRWAKTLPSAENHWTRSLEYFEAAMIELTPTHKELNIAIHNRMLMSQTFLDSLANLNASFGNGKR